MDPWRSAGDVLRWWRVDVLGWTQQQAADSLNIRPNTLSNWERGDRAVSIDLAELDEALRGGRALEGLLWAYGTPDGLEPGRLWSKVFPGESHPVWMWLRSPVPELHFEGEWGVARIEKDLELGPNGAFITVGASLPDSPVIVHFSEPAWADFGHGDLPDIPGAQVVTAVSAMQRSSADGPLMDMFSNSLQEKRQKRSPDVLELEATAPGAIDTYTDRGSSRPLHVPRQWPPTPEGIDAVDRHRFARLRGARGLSLPALTDRVRRQTGLDVSRDTLRRFETDVGRPHDPLLPVALDHTLGAGGRLALLELRAGRGDGVVRFPAYWRGPIWISFEAPEAGTTVILHRGRWLREVPVRGDMLVSAHWFDPQVPLRIDAADPVRWAVGVGRRAGAEPIDQNWVPGTVDVAKQAVTDIASAIHAAVDRHPEA